MNKEQESIQALMEQLISARDPEEARELTARVRRLASQTISPEERLEMYHQARQVVQVRLRGMAEKKPTGPTDKPEPFERFLSSLLRALETPANPAMALSFLRYDIDHDTFYSITPTELAEIDEQETLTDATVGYLLATQAVTWQEEADCEEELKHCILLRLLRWLERENLTQFPEVSFCVRFLREIMGNSIPNEDSPTPMDSLQDVLKAISVAHALGLEMDVEDLAMTCNDQAECLRQCVCLRPALIDMTAFSLVTQICRILQRRKVSPPPIMEQLIRLYIVLSLSTRSSKSDIAFIWTAAGRKE